MSIRKTGQRKTKWVRKAQMYVTTWFDDKGNQHQEWTNGS